ncbi:putative NAD-dependent epimerase/dehydratase domain-containing protein [Seiridium cardinale]|uniref:NAD-dependent epimerase/dehydratase domain-containing protein n=1 Tax=Seiridium cardinale TaxID=138064 RepID=A0ABR2XLW8_9PEZI
MTSSTPTQILLTGATGFIGGTILACLLESDHPALKTATITCLVRGAERADTLSSAYGVRVRPVVYQGIDDLEATTKAASQADIVIGATLGFHPASAQALLRGLAQRRAATGHHVWMIHLSGASNLADQPITGAYLEERTFDDLADDVYGYEKHREALRHYPQRATELGVVDAGLELGVKTLVVMPPTIYGVGTGLFNRKSIQIPAYVRAVLELGSGVVVGEGGGQANHVHVEDLAELYRLVVLAILDNGGANLPTGKKGIVFGENGLHTWMDIAQGIADACHEEGRIKDRSIRSIDLEDAGKYLKSYMDLVGGDLVELELGLCANSRTKSSIARRLGWKPSRGEEAWKRAFGEDLHAVLRAQK